MAKKKTEITKVMKYELHYESGCDSFAEMQSAVWALQKQVREILNKTTQEMHHFAYNNPIFYEKSKVAKKVRSDLRNNIYHQLRECCPDLASSSTNATVRKAWNKYDSAKFDVLTGKISLPSYKSNQPIPIHNESVNLQCCTIEDEEKIVVRLSLFSRDYAKARQNEKKEQSTQVCFSLKLGDGTQKAIVQRILDGTYKLSECQLVYEGRKWFLLLAYSFAPIQHGLDKDKILGVDVGEAYAIYASSKGNEGVFKIEGGEVTDKAKELENRRRSLQKQAAYCGEGRIGHGTKTRVADAYKMQDKLANFRKTINHRYSKALIDYAVKNGYGTIQMEDLSGIKKDTGYPRRLQHWTYYDLQSKIEAKAKEHGIEVRRIDPRYTSQRCSSCGCIDPENRKEQKEFLCVKCGFEVNADYNASQNISIKDIEKIIKKDSAKQKQP